MSFSFNLPSLFIISRYDVHFVEEGIKNQPSLLVSLASGQCKTKDILALTLVASLASSKCIIKDISAFDYEKSTHRLLTIKLSSPFLSPVLLNGAFS